MWPKEKKGEKIHSGKFYQAYGSYNINGFYIVCLGAVRAFAKKYLFLHCISITYNIIQVICYVFCMNYHHNIVENKIWIEFNYSIENVYRYVFISFVLYLFDV